MKITVDRDVADDPSSLDSLDRLLDSIEKGWNLWAVEATDRFEQSAWMQDVGRAGRRARRILHVAVKRAAYPAPAHRRALRVCKEPQGPDEAAPNTAAGVANERLTILVENEFADGAFLGRVMDDLCPELRKYRAGVDQPVRFDCVGGKGQMGLAVEERCAGRPVRPRLVVVVDSDRRAPEDLASQAARTLEDVCRRHHIPCWVLAKREAENYLPAALLRSWPNAGADLQAKVNAWQTLSEDQKDHFDMKSGWPAAMEGSAEALFADLSPGCRHALRDGFGDAVGERWTGWTVRARDELLARSRGDLERGFEIIKQGL